MTKPIDERLRIDAFVLVGGASSRMGQDKAQLIIGGRKLFERAAIVLGEVCSGTISLVGSNSGGLVGITKLGLSARPDLRISGNDLPRAPIVGIYTALVSANTSWIVVLACDLPFITGGLIAKLAGFCSHDLDAVVPVQQDARSQPLCAFYRRENCLPIAEEMLKNGDLKLQRFLSRISTRHVEFDEIADLEVSANFFLNVNEPEDYESALRIR